jgi:hypothetical protein
VLNIQEISSLRINFVSQIQPDIHTKLVEKLQQLIRIDIIAICARLAVILNDSGRRRDLLAQQGEGAQSLLNLFQTVRISFMNTSTLVI